MPAMAAHESPSIHFREWPMMSCGRSPTRYERPWRSRTSATATPCLLLVIFRLRYDCIQYALSIIMTRITCPAFEVNSSQEIRHLTKLRVKPRAGEEVETPGVRRGAGRSAGSGGVGRGTCWTGAVGPGGSSLRRRGDCRSDGGHR